MSIKMNLAKFKQSAKEKLLEDFYHSEDRISLIEGCLPIGALDAQLTEREWHYFFLAIDNAYRHGFKSGKATMWA